MICAVSLRAQTKDSLRYETKENIELRTSPNIQEYLNDPEFQYDSETAKPPEGLWQRIQRWIYQFFRLVNKGGKPLEYIIYVLLFVILLIVLYKLLGLDYQTLVLRKKKTTVGDIPVFEEDIHRLDVEGLIAESIRNRQYRYAVRWLYIKLLKLLSEKDLIEWEINKTNTDYARELKNTDRYKAFNRLTFIFEYIWYGEFEPDKEGLLKYKSEFDLEFKRPDEKKRH